jgi:hypothetical protein
MKNLKQLKEILENGGEISFSNESTFAHVELSHGRTLGGSVEFKIWMNCRFVHLSKTWKSFERKLIELINEHDLEMDV